MVWREGFGPPKNFGVAPLSWEGERKGRDGRRMEREKRGR